tara:strand:+ start:948 stop:1169 length:222 start_codon:yes stop_codon:yes gene_type:complete
MAATARDRGDRGQNADKVIQAAKAKAKRALRQKNPKLTALERAFYLRFKALQAAEANNLIQIKPRRQSRQKAA